MEEISPELAAMIVKNYILPMFESSHKRDLKTKYNKMAGIRAATGRNLKAFNAPASNASVYGELKLS